MKSAGSKWLPFVINIIIGSFVIGHLVISYVGGLIKCYDE